MRAIAEPGKRGCEPCRARARRLRSHSVPGTRHEGRVRSQLIAALYVPGHGVYVPSPCPGMVYALPPRATARVTRAPSVPGNGMVCPVLPRHGRRVATM